MIYSYHKFFEVLFKRNKKPVFTWKPGILPIQS
jgi:hypothetical protein